MGMVPNKQEDTYIDEILSYVFAAGGVYFQFKIGFDMPFPFNLLLWPLGTCLMDLRVWQSCAVLFASHLLYFSFFRNWRILYQVVDY